MILHANLPRPVCTPSARTTGFVILLLSGLLRTAPLEGETIYAESFEDPPFANRSLLAGQNGWVAPGPLSPDAAQIRKGLHSRGKQAVQVLGRDLVHQDFISEATGGYYDAIGSYRHPVDFDTQGNQIVRVSADVYLRGGQQTPEGSNSFSASIAALAELTNGGVAGTGELAISSDGFAYGYSGNSLVPTILASKPITLNAWHHLAVDVDHADQSYSFSVDGSPLGTFPFDVIPDTDDPTAGFTSIFQRASLLAYAAPDDELFQKQNFAAFYDNFEINAVPASAAVVPEPVAAGLMLSGTLGLALIRDRRRRSK